MYKSVEKVTTIVVHAAKTNLIFALLPAAHTFVFRVEGVSYSCFYSKIGSRVQNGNVKNVFEQTDIQRLLIINTNLTGLLLR